MFAQEQIYSFIPQNTDLIVNLNLNNLRASQTCKAVAECGEIDSIYEDLKKIPWNQDKSIPNPLIIYSKDMGLNYALLVSISKPYETFLKDLDASIGKTKYITRSKSNGKDLILIDVEKSHRSSKIKTKEREAEILYLSPSVMAFAREGCHLPLSAFAMEKFPASDFVKLKEEKDGQILYGIMKKFPIDKKNDPTGLSSLIQSAEFSIVDTAKSLLIEAKCKCEDNTKASLAARRIKSFMTIILVSFFSSNKTLFKELNSACTITAQENNVILNINPTKQTIDKIRAFYLDNRDSFHSQMESIISGE